MWVPSRSTGLNIELRRALLPISLGVILLVYLVYRPSMPVMIMLCLILPTWLFLQNRLFEKARRSFEREFSRFLFSGDALELKELIARSRLFPLLAPSGYLDEKRGLIASIEGDWVGAQNLLESAYLRSPRRRTALMPSILRAKYETGAWSEAEEISRDMLSLSETTGTPELFLGLLLCRAPETREEGVKHLERAAGMLGGADRERARSALDELSRR